MTTTEPRTGHGVRETHGMPAGAAPTPSDDQSAIDSHGRNVVTGPLPRTDHGADGAHRPGIGAAQNSAVDHRRRDTQLACVDGGPTSPATVGQSTPMPCTSPGIQDSGNGQSRCDTHGKTAVAAPTPPAPVKFESTPNEPTPVLADPFLALAADVLDDLERVRIANENRLRQLTRTEEDSDGEERGFGLTEDHPDVARLAALVKALADAEHQAELNLKRQLRKHPLGPWVKQARGVGEKQAARLLASIGDPYFNDLHNRPRLVSELWSYCGYGDAAAQVRRRGEKANWSANAKMRAHLVAVSIVKAGGPYREVYDASRVKYADAVHPLECKRCGPAGKPAQPGSPISAGHQHARALRMVAKAVLRDLWREARRLHGHPGDQDSSDAQHDCVVGVLTSDLPGDQRRSDAHRGTVAGVSSPSISQLLRETHAASADGGLT